MEPRLDNATGTATNWFLFTDPALIDTLEYARLSRIDVLVIDDWAMAPPAETERRDFWEICEALFPDGRSQTEVDHGWRQHADAGMAMEVIIPGKESLAERVAVLRAAEAIWRVSSATPDIRG